MYMLFLKVTSRGQAVGEHLEDDMAAPERRRLPGGRLRPCLPLLPHRGAGLLRRHHRLPLCLLLVQPHPEVLYSHLSLHRFQLPRGPLPDPGPDQHPQRHVVRVRQCEDRGLEADAGHAEEASQEEQLIGNPLFLALPFFGTMRICRSDREAGADAIL